MGLSSLGSVQPCAPGGKGVLAAVERDSSGHGTQIQAIGGGIRNSPEVRRGVNEILPMVWGPFKLDVVEQHKEKEEEESNTLTKQQERPMW